MKTKIQLMWEVYVEQEKNFRLNLPTHYDNIELNEFFKGIRGSEYRRGKEDTRHEIIKLIKKMDKGVSTDTVTLNEVIKRIKG